MFTEQILKSILSLKSFSAAPRDCRPALEGIHVSVDADRKTITAMATDTHAAVRMVIGVPEVTGMSWERNLSLAALKAALATVKAGGSVTFFSEAPMPEFPVRLGSIIDNFITSEATAVESDINAKYLGAIAKVDVMGDKSGRWKIQGAARPDKDAAVVAKAEHGPCQVDVAIMPMDSK